MSGGEELMMQRVLDALNELERHRQQRAAQAQHHGLRRPEGMHVDRARRTGRAVEHHPLIWLACGWRRSPRAFCLRT